MAKIITTKFSIVIIVFNIAESFGPRNNTKPSIIIKSAPIKSGYSPTNSTFDGKLKYIESKKKEDIVVHLDNIISNQHKRLSMGPIFHRLQTESKTIHRVTSDLSIYSIVRFEYIELGSK